LRSIRSELIEAAKEHGGRKGEIHLWRIANPKEAKDFDAYVAEFVAVRKDGANCSFNKFREILEARLSLRVSQNTLTNWVRKQYPDEPSLKY